MLIPKKIHQIWLGGPVPETFAGYAKRWQEMHPGWEYRLWREEDLRWLEHLEEFERVRHFATKANIARYEIVARHGGVYLDMDFEPLKPLDPLLQGESMLVCPECPELLANGFFAAAPDHPVLKYVLSQLSESIAANAGATSPEMCGPVFFTRAVRRASAITGASCRWLDRRYFYPYNHDQPEFDDVPDFPGAFAVHRWAKSWVAATPQPRDDRTFRQRMRARIIAGATRVVHALERVRPATTRIVPAGPDRVLVNVQGRFTVLVPGNDLNLLPQLVMHGISDAPYLNFLARILRPSDHVVDIGANIGYTVVAAAVRLGRYGRIDAFEPNPDARKVLEDNVYMNRMLGMEADVRIHACAIGASAQTAMLRTPSAHRGRGSLNPAVHEQFQDEHLGCDTFEVRVAPLTDELRDAHHIRLVKVDVEGYEAQVLRNLLPLLEAGRIDWLDLEVNSALAGASWDALENLLRDLVTRLNARCYTLRDDGTPVPVDIAGVIQGPPLSHLALEFRQPPVSA